MDEYDYLEAQVDGGKLPPPPALAEANGKENKDKDRERSGSRRRSRSRSKDRSSRRDRSRSKDRKDKRDDRDRRDRDHGRDRDRDRDRDRGRDRRDDRDFGRGNRGRDRTPDAVRIQREKEQELKDLERTVRTIMVMNLNLRAEERDIFEFFVKAGGINDIKLIRDKNTKRSKGIAYVEFATVESAISALTLNGQTLLSMPVLVKPSEAEKNLAWEAQQQAKNQQATTTLLNKMGGSAPGVRLNPIKLQILNLPAELGEDDLSELFKPFGDINYVKVVRDAAGVSTGEAYVQYADKPMADNAIAHFNGYVLVGKKLTVQVAPLIVPTMMPGMMTGGAPLDPTAAAAAVLAHAQPAPGAPPVPNGNEVDDLDEAENKSLKLNAQSRAALMSRLASSAGLQAPPSFLQQAAQPAAPVAPTLAVPQQVLLDQGLLGPASPIPTPCILLKNMFSDADKAEATWQEDVADDVKSEATKFGEVLHCYVDPNSKGHVYLKFTTQQAAEAASRALHGRFYSGNQIVVSFQFVHEYNRHFGLR
uniref:RRM domain-containing protein n=1 Tax=Chlamydomonas leiostraca TaxID=1034604 RepID=A0A7S0RKZ5_9CHLO|mmetsp:Transcript_25701/g.65291  ORF Transcript_25701/g.65291 Transcript_25701/m.65291 type:complete len:534 (+) Transcript_25701:78-1679(+)